MGSKTHRIPSRQYDLVFCKKKRNHCNYIQYQVHDFCNNHIFQGNILYIFFFQLEASREKKDGHRTQLRGEVLNCHWRSPRSLIKERNSSSAVSSKCLILRRRLNFFLFSSYDGEWRNVISRIREEWENENKRETSCHDDNDSPIV